MSRDTVMIIKIISMVVMWSWWLSTVVRRNVPNHKWHSRARSLSHELKYPALVAIIVYYLCVTYLDDTYFNWVAILVLILWVLDWWWNHKNDDDDRWKRRFKRLLSRVQQTGDKLVVVEE